MGQLFARLHWHVCTVFIVFCLSMFYPVLTTRILSVRHDLSPSESVSAPAPIFRPAAFIPLAFLFWNAGDLLGRLVAAAPALAMLRRSPRLLLLAATARLIFLPLYGLCNLDGDGAAIASDLFYVLVVQMGFGLTNGCFGSLSMMAAAEDVDDGEREAAGAFMCLCLVAGLSVGSLLSFLAAAVF